MNSDTPPEPGKAQREPKELQHALDASSPLESSPPQQAASAQTSQLTPIQITQNIAGEISFSGSGSPPARADSDALRSAISSALHDETHSPAPSQYPQLADSVLPAAQALLAQRIVILHSKHRPVLEDACNLIISQVAPVHLRRLLVSSLDEVLGNGNRLCTKLCAHLKELSRSQDEDTLVRVVLNDQDHQRILLDSLRTELSSFAPGLLAARVFLLFDVRPIALPASLSEVQRAAAQFEAPFFFIDALPHLVSTAAPTRQASESILSRLTSAQRSTWEKDPIEFQGIVAEHARKGPASLEALANTVTPSMADENIVQMLDNARPPERACHFLASFLPPLPVSTFAQKLVPALLEGVEEEVEEQKVTVSDGKTTTETVKDTKPALQRWNTADKADSIRRSCGLRAAQVDDQGTCIVLRDPMRKPALRAAFLEEFPQTVSTYFHRIRKAGMLMDLDQPKALATALNRLAGEVAILFPEEFGQPLLTAHVQAFSELASAIIRQTQPEAAQKIANADDLLEVLVLMAEAQDAHEELKGQLNRLFRRVINRIANICDSMLGTTEQPSAVGLRIVEDFLRSLIEKKLHKEAIALAIALHSTPQFPFWKWCRTLLSQSPTEPASILKDYLIGVGQESPPALTNLLAELQPWLHERQLQQGNELPAPWFALVIIYRISQATCPEYFDARGKALQPLPALHGYLLTPQDKADPASTLATWLTHFSMPKDLLEQRRELLAELLVDWQQIAQDCIAHGTLTDAPTWQTQFEALVHKIYHLVSPQDRYMLPSAVNSCQDAALKQLPSFYSLQVDENATHHLRARREAAQVVLTHLQTAPKSPPANPILI